MTDRRFIQQQYLDSQGLPLKAECRFCRLYQQYNKYEHVAPCGCMGGTRFVHRICLQRWVVVKFQHVYNTSGNGQPQEFNVFCQVCQQRMEIEFNIVHKIISYQDFVERIIQKRMLFAFLVFVLALVISAIVFMSIYSAKLQSGVDTAAIIVFCISIVFLIILVVVFVLKFLINKSIDIISLPNNKDPPKIINMDERDINQIQDEDQIQPNYSNQDPHFGGETKRNKITNLDKSLMLQSKRDSASGSSSVVSKTFTDILMKKMYNHDLPSQKGREKENQNAKIRDQEIQVTIHQHDQIKKKGREEASRRDEGVQKSYNGKDQSIQPSVNLKDASLQYSTHQKDVSIQPSMRQKDSKQPSKRSRHIFPEQIKKDEQVQKPLEVKNQKKQKVFLSNLPTRNIKEQKSEDQSDQKSSQKHSNDSEKKSNFQLVGKDNKFIKPQRTESKLKLKNKKDPIKIRVLF